MSAIPISHRSKTCFQCTEPADSPFISRRSMRPWRGRFDPGRQRSRWGMEAFVCQGCVENAAIVLAGVPQLERETTLRRVARRKDIRQIL
jgi:hypothetical protein